MLFTKQEKSGINKHMVYQVGYNACIACKKDRPINERGPVCEICANYTTNWGNN